MMEDNSKKIFLSVLGVAILLVAVIGVSFAAFSYSGGGRENSIQSGSLTVNYVEAKQGIQIDDALPMTVEAGKSLVGEKNTFSFSVSTKATGNKAINIPYVITVTPDENNTLTNDQVMVYLADGTGATGEGVSVVDPVKVSELTAATGTRTGSFILKSVDTNNVTSTLKTDSYVLKMWIENSVDPDTFVDEAGAAKSLTYKLKVNVDASADYLTK